AFCPARQEVVRGYLLCPVGAVLCFCVEVSPGPAVGYPIHMGLTPNPKIIRKVIFDMKQKLLAAAIAVSASAMAHADKPSFTAESCVVAEHNRCIVRFHDSFSGADAPGIAKRLVGQSRSAGHANAAAQYVYRNTIKGATLNLSCAAASAVFGGDSAI